MVQLPSALLSRGDAMDAKRQGRSRTARSVWSASSLLDRKSTRLNSSHTDIYTLSLHDALPIYDTITKRPIIPRGRDGRKAARPQPNRAKRLECVQLAGAVLKREAVRKREQAPPTPNA